MALYDRAEAKRKEEAKNKYEELKRHITSIDEDMKLNGFFPAMEHMTEMEQTIERQKKELERYRAFFVMIRDLTPERPGTNTPIG